MTSSIVPPETSVSTDLPDGAVEPPETEEVALERAPLVRDLGADERRAVMAGGELVTAEGGSTIVEEDEPGAALYLLLSGEVAVLVGLDGDRIEVARLGEGDTFGEMGLLLGQPRSATIMALRPVRLLRFDGAALTALVERVPAFGLALARDIAGRLQQALGTTTQLHLDGRSDKVVVPSQDLSHMRSYMARYYVTAVRNVAKRHRLLVTKQFPRYECEIDFTEQDQQRWFDLFEPDEAGRRAPFTYYTSSGTMLLMRIVEDVGVNFRHLMHLRSDLTFDPGGRLMEPGVRYRLSGELARIVPMGDDKVALVVQTRLEDPDRNVLQLNEDSFVILNVDPAALELLREASVDEGASEGLVGLAKRAPQLLVRDDVERVTLEVAEDLGMRYGRVSGDLNLVHTTRRAAKLFGHPKPFIQGLCTANLVLQELTSATSTHLLHLDISFARRVFVGQQVELAYDETSFEVGDGGGKLLAFGGWRRA